jgi:histidyl-tRNA synthetase
MLESVSTPAPVFIAYFSKTRGADYGKLAMELRRAGIGTEVYPAAKKLGEQLKYADRRGFRYALVIGDEEWESGRCQVKHLATKQSEEVAQKELVEHLGRLLAAQS